MINVTVREMFGNHFITFTDGSLTDVEIHLEDLPKLIETLEKIKEEFDL